MNKKASVAKWVALAVVPVSLTVVVMKAGQQRRAEAATRRVLSAMEDWESGLNLSTSELEKLIAEGANVNVRVANGSTPLHYALRFYSKENKDFARILTDNGADVNARDEKGSTPLINAVRSEDVETVRLLLSKGANPNLGSREDNGREHMPLPSALDVLKSGNFSSLQHPERIVRSDLLEIIQLLKAAGAKE